ncbi:MAG TPA: hypothetical protein VLA36_09180, partial [Longimicrobiales bacterium]|nr:hypothetical protein [Longimicrobiales bacterium]
MTLVNAVAERFDAQRPLMSAAAGRWSELWPELEFGRATLLDRAPGVKADVYDPRVELTPQLFDLRRGRRFITIWMEYRDGVGFRMDHKVIRTFGQFINIPFADWAVADQVWEVLQTGDMGVSFQDLSAITGDHDQASRAADQRHRERWIQRVWELKNRLEEIAAKRTRAALERITAYIESRPEAAAALAHGSVLLPASLLGPDGSTEAVTRFRINQGMYGDHTYFIDR